MIRGKEDITDKEFEELLLPFYDNYNKYMINYVIPDTIAFYLANGHNRDCLSDCPLYNHINSAIDIFNINCDINSLIPQIKQILKIKFNLKIVNDNPLKIEKLI